MGTGDVDDEAKGLLARVATLETELAHHSMLGPLLEAIPAVVMRVGLDARIEFINRILPEYAGPPLVGNTIYDFAPADQHETMRTAFERAVAGHGPVHYESVAEAPNGTRDVYSSTFGPILEGKELVGLVLVCVNVSGERAAELALLDREARLRLALEVGNVGIWRWDLASDHVQWDNKVCEIFGVAPADAPKTRAAFVGMASADQAVALDAHITRAVETGEYPDFELRVDTPTGVSWFIIKGGAVHDQSGRVAALMGGVIDDTERRRFAQRMAETRKLEAVGQLAAGVAHNFNNALSAVILALELARDRLPAPDSAQMTDALSAAFHAAGLVRDLMAFSRGRSQAPSRREPLANVLRRAVELTHRTFDRRIVVTTKGLEEAWLSDVHVHAAAVEPVIVNLLLNARDALDGLSGDRARIDVSARRVPADGAIQRLQLGAPAEFVEIVVRDRGRGMTPEVQRRCFEPFFTTKAVGKGTGLGLSTAWAAVQAEGGFIDCASSLGEGTTFRVRLPAIAPSESDTAHGPPRTDAPAVRLRTRRGEGRVVLVVDDEPHVRRSFIALLESDGFTVLGAESGDAAVSLVEQRAVDVVLLDHGMPGLSPEETLARLRKLYPNLPVVSHSGLDRVLEGASAHLSKPARGDAILETLEAVLPRRKA